MSRFNNNQAQSNYMRDVTQQQACPSHVSAKDIMSQETPEQVPCKNSLALPALKLQNELSLQIVHNSTTQNQEMAFN